MKKRATATQLSLPGDLTIFAAVEARQRLLDALSQAQELEVDLSHVTEIDSAGVQLLIAAKREAAARQKTLRLIGHSPAVFDLLELANLSGHLGDPVLIRSRDRRKSP